MNVKFIGFLTFV
jgi:hypothetical protein